MAAASTLTNDTMIRAAVKARLSRRHAGDPDAFVVEELPVSRASARVDLAVLNGRIEGVEIKSAVDTLARLPRQARAYGEGMERMALVVAPNHLDEAMEAVPAWWSVLEASAGPRGGVALRRVRRGGLNPDRSARGYLRLLEREEIVALLALHELDRGVRTAPWRALTERAEQRLPLASIAAGVRHQLKLRVLIEAHICRTVFGRSAAGGGLSSDPRALTSAPPAGSGAG